MCVCVSEGVVKHLFIDRMAIKMRRHSSKAESKAEPESSSRGNALLDWFENNCALDLMGCEDGCSMATRDAVNSALGVPNQRRRKQEPDWHAVDYEALHDELLESLLFEQAQLKRNGDDATSAGTSSLIPEELSNSTLSSHSEQVQLEEPTSPRKRRRQVRLHRRRTPPKRKHRIAPIEPKLDSSNSSMSTVSFVELSKSSYPDPSHYFHPQCRMQKDKGRGEPVGAQISAKGRDHCLEKLRTKMSLLTEHAMDKTATIKRRKARVAEHYENFVETRSLIELRMGFLSIQYGVLLRWDTGRTGKVTLVVLRKMCHESFYPKKSVQRQPPPDKLVVEKTEVKALDPPYCVPRPDNFGSSVLSIGVGGLRPQPQIPVVPPNCVSRFRGQYCFTVQ